MSIPSSLKGFMILMACFVLLSSALAGCGGGKEKGEELIIFHAGSLSVPFSRIAGMFEKENPGVKVLLEPAGSRACARKITELGRKCDVMASADYEVIDALLIPDFADWNIKFASNEMTIAYTGKSREASRIDTGNWYKVLLYEDVAYGRSNPDSDPCGYRSVLVMKLAQKYYGREGLADSMLAKDNEYIRPKETDLLGLLEAGAIDYIFIYRSVANQHGLRFVTLPDEINLKRQDLSEHYATVSVDISGKAPGESITRAGAPMIYGVTIPKNAPNGKLALRFVEFLLDADKGLKVMEECGQQPVVPAATSSYGMLPAELERFALPQG